MHETVLTGQNQTRVYRNILLVLPRAALLALLGLTLLLSMALYATHMPAKATADGRVVSHVVAIAFAAVGVAAIGFAIRSLASGIRVHDDGVIVNRVIRRRQFVPWADVTGFQLAPARRLNNSFTSDAVAVAVQRAGQPPVYCLGASFAGPTAKAEQMVADLQSELLAHR
jgi:hypothetical protein